jgi:hypothetical protein
MKSNIILEYKRSDKKFNSLDTIDSTFFHSFVKAFFTDYNVSTSSDSTIELFNEFKSDYLSFVKFLRNIVTKDSKTLEFLKNLTMEDKLEYLAIINDLFDFWRNKRRFLILENVENGENPQQLIVFFNYFNSFVESFYRLIYETIYCRYQTNYRELPAGCNAALLTNIFKYKLPDDLEFLNDVRGVEAVVTRPPFMFNSEQNTRKGTFFTKDLKISKDQIKGDQFLSVMVKVNHKRGLVVLNKDFLYYLPAMANLFEIDVPKVDEVVDFVVLFGIDNLNEKPYYYMDDGVYVGVLPTMSQIDYFGYLKKMILTLFNLGQIDHQNLPIHGSAVQITLKNGESYNLCFLGDSGAGKSETLEAIKNLHNPMIKSLKTIFDDMGTFFIKDNDVVMSGTEIGAFVRVDDLDKGYPLRSVDRAIYMNIDETNSRTIIPIVDYRSTCKKYHVDYFFLVNNFVDSEVGLEQFLDENVALSEFKKGERKAKGTTDEIGLVSTYFANPFGPLQKEADVEKFINNYFDLLYKNKVFVGRLYSKLSLDPVNGPKLAAKSIIEQLSNRDTYSKM